MSSQTHLMGEDEEVLLLLSHELWWEGILLFLILVYKELQGES